MIRTGGSKGGTHFAFRLIGITSERLTTSQQKQGHAALTTLLAALGIALGAGFVTAALLTAFGSGDRATAARGTRTALLLAFAVSYAVLPTRGRPPLVRACGFAPAARPVVSYVHGLLAGILPLVALILILLAFGARSFEIRGGFGKLSWLGAKFLLLGIPLTLLEEGLFRGLLLGDAVRRLGSLGGVALASLFFAATHFLGASQRWRAVPEPAGNAIDVVGAIVAGSARMIQEWPEFVGLTLVGVVLSFLRLRTGHAYLAMGVHAGWYWVKQMDRYFVREIDEVVVRNQIWIGSGQYLDGVMGWAVLLGSLALAMAVPWNRSVRSVA